MLHPSTKRLIDKLNDMTRRQRVIWTEGENASVVHDTEGYRVIVTAEPHTVLLTDALGREIETCTPEEFADDVDAQGRPYARFVADLYREAHRHARGTEKAILTLLAGLDAAELAVPAEIEPEPIGELDPTTDETAPLESETAITAAVASLADQINGHADAPVSAEAPAPPDVPAEEPPSAMPEPEPPVAETTAEPIAADSYAAATASPVFEPEPETIPEAGEIPPETETLEPEPGSFGTFGAFEHAPGEPAPLPAEPESAQAALPAHAAPEPEPEHILPAAPTLPKPISLSSIPFGFGLGAAQRYGTPSHPATTPPDPEPVDAGPPSVIDGTADLPDDSQAPHEEIASAEPYPPVQPTAGPDDLPGETPAPLLEPGQPRRFNPWN